MPWSQRADGPGLGILGSLFTAASAFCVTGLVLTDTAATFTFFGQAVLLVLMELGGVGVMTFAALAFSILGRRLSLAGQAALTDVLFQNDAALEFRTLFAALLKAVLLIQAGGAAVLYLAIRLDGTETLDGVDPLWSALFHTVSAFCNAGFSIYRDNLAGARHSPLFLTGICVLVILGGLGHGVLAELYHLPARNNRPRGFRRRLSLNTRVCLVTTVILLAGGVAALGLSDFLFDGGGMGDAAFHSIVARTAGFNTTALDGIPLPSCLILCGLMFVGGCPGSCAGGIKITSLVLWLGSIRATLRGETSVDVMGYTMSRGLVAKARLILALSGLWVVAGLFLLSIYHPAEPLHVLLFEQVSALATVGLSMNFTPQLEVVPQIWILLSMILGKLGPLTIAFWIVVPSRSAIGKPENRLMIG